MQGAADVQARHYRCVGIGVGPANLSLASLMHGYPEITNLFVDKNVSFGRHDGQQIPDASIQVSMLKDLVTLSAPTSAFSFLSYLHELGRIYYYLNAQLNAVPQHEYRSYMEWACQKNENIVFGQEVLSVDYTDRFRIRPRENIELDVVIWATGFRPAPLHFLDPIKSRLELEGDQYKIDGSFAVLWDGPAEHNVFLQNAARGQRGLADPNLSLNARRSQRTLDRIRGVCTSLRLNSFIEWVTKPSSAEVQGA